MGQQRHCSMQFYTMMEEAENSAAAFRNLTTEQQTELLEFLEGL